MPRYRRSRTRKPFGRSTRKKILDVTTRKKQDNMLLESYVTADNPYGTTGTRLPAVLRGNFTGPGTGDNLLDRTPYAFLWCATARAMTASVASVAGRNVIDPYMVGLRETIEIQISTGVPWQWRRICFRTKRDMAAALSMTSNASYYTPTSDGSARRTVSNLTGNRNGGEQYALYELLFQGQNDTDWVDPMVAKIDTTRMNIVSDTVKTLSCGNEAGMIRKFKRWYPMHKTLVYNGDEQGSGVISADFSTKDSPGMGDFYVVDLFRARYAAGAAAVLTFSPQATLYWHEK